MADLDIERIYDEHADALFAFVLTMTRNEADTHDILQELFSQLVRHPERLIGMREERPYLLKFAYHATIDQFRRRGARDRVQLQLSAEDRDLFAPSADPDEAEFRAKLSAALSELPEEQWTVVHLKLWQGLAFREIADALGIPANTAASRYRYGIDKLRERLRPIYDDLQPRE